MTDIYGKKRNIKNITALHVKHMLDSAVQK